jgi:replicative DNA helicase
VADVSRCLKLVAKELGISVIALTQLNNDGASRESRAIEHDCDLFFVIRFDEEHGYFLDIRLARNCSRTSFPMDFRPEYLRFDPRDNNQQQ